MSQGLLEAHTATCHPNWIEYVTHRLRFSNWAVSDGLLLLADIWPVDAVITDELGESYRYGAIESPTVMRAGLLSFENRVCFISDPQYGNSRGELDDGDRLRILAGKRLGWIRELWGSDNLQEQRYPPSFYVRWAEGKGFRPCWFDLWNQTQTEDQNNSTCSATATGSADPSVELAAVQVTKSAPQLISGATADNAAPRKPERKDGLTNLILEAQKQSTDPFDTHSIWQILRDMAESKKWPFWGLSESGLKWGDQYDYKELTIKMLRDRLLRQKKDGKLAKDR